MVVETEGGTHLDCATLPSEDGRLALVAEDIVFAISKLCAKNFGVPFQDLKDFISQLSPHTVRVFDHGRTLMAREFPGSSSNLYSVSGSSTHSLVLDLPESLADIGTENHADTESKYFVMNFRCYAPGDALDERQWNQRMVHDATYHTGNGPNRLKKLKPYSIACCSYPERVGRCML